MPIAILHVYRSDVVTRGAVIVQISFIYSKSFIKCCLF